MPVLSDLPLPKKLEIMAKVDALPERPLLLSLLALGRAANLTTRLPLCRHMNISAHQSP